MKEIKFKYKEKMIRLCLFKVALLFSVFAFTGFNEKIESAFHESDNTELVDSRIDEADFSLNFYSKSQYQIPFTKSLTFIKSIDSSALINFNQSIEVKYKAIIKASLSYDFSYIKLPSKIAPSSKEEASPFAIA